MSRVGKQELNIPAGVTVTKTGATITVVGPKGTLSRDFRNEIEITIEGNTSVFG
jgi:large subunit ribosomal protein L6